MTLLRLPSGTVLNMDQIVMFWPLSDAGTNASLQIVTHTPMPQDVDEVLAVRDEDAIALHAMLLVSANPVPEHAAAAAEDWQLECARLRAEQAQRDETALYEVRDDSAS